MLKKIFILIFVLICLLKISIIKVHAADEHTISSSFPVEMCVTDDANKFTKMERCTTDGYPKVSIADPLNPSGGVDVNIRTLSVENDSINVLPDTATVTKNITSNTSTVVKNAAGTLFNLIVGVAGAASTTAILYDDADCASLPAAIGTIDTSQMSVITPARGIPFTAGLCIVTSGSANIIVVYK